MAPPAPAPFDVEPCDICGTSGALVPDLQVSLAGLRSVWVHRCRRCGFRQIRPRVGGVDLAALYSGDYFHAYTRESYRRRREAYFLLKRLRRLAPDGRLLEVGCGLGFLPVALRDAGRDVTGIDVSPFAVYYARTRFGLPVTCTTLEAAQFPAGSFSFVILKDVLEHVSHPRQHLRETSRILREGGHVWLITPNGEANLRPLQAVAQRRSGGAATELPLLDQGHLSFFSRDHLRRLFGECGFEVVRSRAIGIRRGLQALGWLPGQARFGRTAPARLPSQPRRSEAVTGRLSGEEYFADLASRIDAEVERTRSRIRQWVPYYYAHRAFKQLDALPVASGLGYDFEFLLRRP